MLFFLWSRQTATDSMWTFSNTNFGKSLKTIKIQWSHTKVFETDFIIIIALQRKCDFESTFWVLSGFCCWLLNPFEKHSNGSFRTDLFRLTNVTRWKRFIIILSFYQFFSVFSFRISSFSVFFLNIVNEFYSAFLHLIKNLIHSFKQTTFYRRVFYFGFVNLVQCSTRS